MKKRSKTNIYTFIIVFGVIFGLGIITIPIFLDQIQNIYLTLQLDVNRRNAEGYARFLEKRIKAGDNKDKIIADFQTAITGTEADKGFLCLVNTEGYFLCHPVHEIVGKSLSSLGLKIDLMDNSKKDEPWQNEFASTKTSFAGILTAPVMKTPEIVYSQRVNGTNWTVNSHENLSRINGEITQLRHNSYLFFIITGLAIAMFSSVGARVVGKTYEKKIEDINAELQNNVNNLNLANYELESLNNEKNEFLGIVAHDLKNPLSGILISSDLISNYFDKMTKAEIIQKLESVKSTTKHMTSIVMNLLDINSIEQGKINLEIEVLSPKEVLKEIVNDYSLAAEKKALKLIVENVEGPEIRTDRKVFREVADNLLSNAVKYSPASKNIFLTTFYDDNYFNIRIKDEGPGISEQDMQKLFGKFARLSAKPTGGEHSTGLGLSIVKKLIEMQGGKVTCESQLGEGASFTASFPRG